MITEISKNRKKQLTYLVTFAQLVWTKSLIHESKILRSKVT